MPTLLYLIGMSSFIAVGTVLFQSVFSASYGGFRYFLHGDIVWQAFLVMILTSSVGVITGASITRYLHGIVVRFTLSIAILAAALSAILRLVSIQFESINSNLESIAMIILLCGIGLSIIIIAVIFIMGFRHRREKSVPAWFKPLLTAVAES